MTDEELKKYLDQQFADLRTYIDKRTYDLETRLLKAFERWSTPFAARVATLEAVDVNKRLSLLEERVHDLEHPGPARN